MSTGQYIILCIFIASSIFLSGYVIGLKERRQVIEIRSDDKTTFIIYDSHGKLVDIKEKTA